MTSASGDKISLYNKRLQSLYDDVSRWLQEAKIPFMPSFEEITLSEERLGSYAAKKFIIKQNDEVLARFIPVGILIIGAEGWVDLCGKSGKETLVYFSEGGPELTFSMSVGATTVEKRTAKIYGQKREGWHWIDDRITGKQPEFTKDIFLALLERIN